MNAGPQSDNHALVTILQTLLQRRLIIFLFIGHALLGTALHHIFFPSYQGRATLHIMPQNNGVQSSTNIRLPMMSGSEPDAQRYLKTLNSGSFGSFVEQQLKKSPEDLSFLRKNLGLRGKQTSDVASFLTSHTDLRHRDDDLIDVVVDASSEVSAARMTNLMADFARRYILFYETRNIEATTTYLQEKISQEQNRIEELNQAIIKIKNKEGLLRVTSGDATPPAAKSIDALQREFDMVEVKIRENTSRIADLIARLPTDGAPFNLTQEDSVSLNLRGRVIDKIKDLKEERGAYNSRLSALTDQLKSLKSSFNPGSEQKLTEISKRLELEYQIYLDLKKQLFNMELYKNTAKDVIRDYSRATPLTVVRKLPLSSKFLLTVLLSLVAIVLLIHLWGILDPKVYNYGQFLAVGVQFLGSVPTLGPSRGWLSKALDRMPVGQSSLLTDFHKKTREAIAIQSLRLKIRQLYGSPAGRPLVISVVSPVEGEGRSTIAANLAACFSYYGEKTALIDGDVDSGGLSRWLKKSQGQPVGAADGTILSGFTLIDHDSAVHYLDRMSKEGLSKAFGQQKKPFDIVIIDSPPVLERDEATVIAQNSDVVVLVCAELSTHIDDLVRTVELLRLNNIENICGLINKTRHYIGSQLAYQLEYQTNRAPSQLRKVK